MMSMKFITWTSFLVVALSFYLHKYHQGGISSYVNLVPIGSGIFQRLNTVLERIIPTKFSGSNRAGKHKDNLMTSRELMEFNGKSTNGKLYLSVLGQIFDVSKGRKHYGPGGGYHFFTGRDASRAFVTGDFSEEGLTDDVSNLSATELRGLKGWTDFYKKEYTYVGKLVGRYYDSEGYETPYLIEVHELIRRADIENDDAEREKRKFPPCNSEWSRDKGSRVWCTKLSGGIERNWAGVPRKHYVVGSSKPRCACIRHPNEVSSAESHEPTLNDPQLEEYPGCPEDSHSCWIKS